MLLLAKDHFSTKGDSMLSYAELAAATEQFEPSRILGRGGFGSVYRCELPQLHDLSVVIKVLEATDGGGQAITDLEREVRMLSNCRHESIVPLVAFSMEPSKPLCLVTLFMSGGALSDALCNADRRASLGAVARLRIARYRAS